MCLGICNEKRRNINGNGIVQAIRSLVIYILIPMPILYIYVLCRKSVASAILWKYYKIRSKTFPLSSYIVPSTRENLFLYKTFQVQFNTYKQKYTYIRIYYFCLSANNRIFPTDEIVFPLKLYWHHHNLLVFIYAMYKYFTNVHNTRSHLFTIYIVYIIH